MMEAKAQVGVSVAVLRLPACPSNAHLYSCWLTSASFFLPAVSLMLFEGHRSNNQFHWLMLFIIFFNGVLTFIDILKYSFVMSTACLYLKKK